MYTGKSAAAIFSVIPAFFLYVLLMDTDASPYLKAAVLIAVLARLIAVFMPFRKQILTYGWFVLDIVALFLYFYMGFLGDNNPADKLLFIFLVLMTLSAFQRDFPIYYFVMLGIIVFAIPMSKDPIDWTPVMRIGERIADSAENLSYSFPIKISGNSYSAGYSSLNRAGGVLKNADKTQLILRSYDKPYYVYKDEESGDNVRVRKVLYLTGGVGENKEQFVNFINFLYKNGIGSKEAVAFSEIANINVEYAYIDTKDEIAPAGSIMLKNKDTRITEGRSSNVHKKGYSLDAVYLNMDLGSPYLAALLRNAGNLNNSGYLSYEEACDYANDLYNIDLQSVVEKSEYDEMLLKGAESEYLITEGATEKMRELADKLTKGASTDYDKCRIIEEYLRQYPYNTNAVGGHKPSSDMSTPEGMADIADRFLFETGEGYCVHYTSAMVMLLRLSGIPARAVTGFRYVAPFEKSDTYPVNSSLAHTWPEAYIENAGWICFEPTGGFYAASEYTWHREIEEEKQPEMEEDYIMEETVIPELPEIYDVDPVIIEENTAESKMVSAFRVVIPVVLSIVAILLIIIAGNSVIRHIVYTRGSNARKLRMDVEQIKREINIISGNRISDRGLLSDYVEEAPDDLKGDVQTVFDNYYRLIYGNYQQETVTQEEVELSKNMRNTLVQQRKRKQNRKRIAKMA